MKQLFLNGEKLEALKKELVEKGYTGSHNMYLKTVHPFVILYNVNALFENYIEVEQMASLGTFFITAPVWMGVEQFEQFALQTIEIIKHIDD